MLKKMYEKMLTMICRGGEVPSQDENYRIRKDVLLKIRSLCNERCDNTYVRATRPAIDFEKYDTAYM